MVLVVVMMMAMIMVVVMMVVIIKFIVADQGFNVATDDITSKCKTLL